MCERERELLVIFWDRQRVIVKVMRQTDTGNVK